MVTARDSGLSRAPLQLGQGLDVMYCSISPRIHSLLVSRYRRMRFGITPSK